MVPKKETNNEKNNSNFPKVKSIIENITKDYGQGVITTLEEGEVNSNNTLSTGSFILDQAIGGGYAFGRIIEIYGRESSGKTTLALHAVAECQKAGKVAAYIDLENALDVRYAEKIGVNKKELMILSPKHGEEALDLVNSLVKQNVGLIVVDSVAALIPKVELEADLDKQTIGLRARLMSSALVKINNSLAGKETIVIFINQIRNKISTGFFAGNPETTSGGVSLAFFASLIIRLQTKERIEKNNEYIGIKTQAKVNKNKLASPYKEPILEIIFARGIQKEREVIDLATELNLFQKGGSWYSYKEQKLGNGKENVTDYLVANPNLFEEIEKEVKKNLENTK
jgi:recombination protein RecA